MVEYQIMLTERVELHHRSLYFTRQLNEWSDIHFFEHNISKRLFFEWHNHYMSNHDQYLHVKVGA